MRLFYYVHTGHRYGLDRFRRACSVIRMLEGADITLLTSDFRIASLAREFGVKRAVGIDVVRNIPQIAQMGDKIIFDSDEHNPTMLSDMTGFFSTFIRISDNPEDTKHPKEKLVSPYLSGEGICHAVMCDPLYFDATPKTIERSLFFGDDDYDTLLLEHLKAFAPLGLELGLGFYYFLDYEQKIASAFTKLHESDAYDTLVTQSALLLTASPHAALASLAGGGRPIFLQRPDKFADFKPLCKRLGIPYLEHSEWSNLHHVIEQNRAHRYEVLPNEAAKVITFIKEALSL